MLLGSVTNVAISRAVAEDIGHESLIIPNPYRDRLFRVLPETTRARKLIFVGRLVSDKGVDLLLHALSLLRREGLEPDLTVVGAGPEAENLSALSRELALGHQVSFVGQKTAEEVLRLLNEHRIMVISSRWAEPFGVVALEGIACGCAIVGSEAGGLKEAIGPCGITFANGSERSLADALKRVLLDQSLEDSFRHARAGTSGKVQSARNCAGIFTAVATAHRMILLSHATGNENVRQAALGLQEADLLGEFWTCLSWDPESSINRLLPDRWRDQFARRAVPENVRPFVHTRPTA